MGVHNPPRANAAIALVRHDDAGMGSGINETFQQSGFAFGVAVLGAVAHSHIISHFKAALAGHGLSAAQLAHGASAVSSGAIKPVVAGVPPALRATVHNAAVDSFTSGFHVVLIAGAIVTLVGGIVAFVLIRTKDFLVDPASVMTGEADQQAAEATSEPQLEPKSAPDPPRAREGAHVGLAQGPDHSYQPHWRCGMNRPATVMIVGAGPSGLTLACELARRDSPHQIIDSRPGPSKEPKALVLWSGALEALGHLGIRDAALAGGLPLSARATGPAAIASPAWASSA